MKKTILVTGGAGHVGSHVIELLLKEPNNKVISLDNYFNGSKKNHINGAEYRTGHTKDIDDIIAEKPDVIYHLGEYARIATSFDDINLVFDMNLIGTYKVLEFCRNRGVGKLVYAASSTKYAIEGNGRHQNPYSFTKATNVDLIKDYGNWYELPFAICYFYNAFGPREKGSGKMATVVAKFEQAYLSGDTFKVVMPGNQKRNFTYVKDLARGIIMVGEKGIGDGYSLNNKKQTSIIDLAKMFGGEIELVQGYPGRQESGDSPDKARSELGWETTLDIDDYIASFVKNAKKLTTRS